MNTKFFTYIQNNSGGSFEVDLSNGISEIVIIEALNSYEANNKAEQIGIYFNGCDSGLDCECCGDRWYECDERDGKEKPLIYDTNAYDYVNDFFSKDIIIYYLNKPFEIVNKI